MRVDLLPLFVFHNVLNLDVAVAAVVRMMIREVHRLPCCNVTMFLSLEGPHVCDRQY